MDQDEKPFQDKIQLGTIAAFLVGLFILVLGAGMFLFKGGSSSQAEDVQIISASSSPGLEKDIMVDVAGAVVTPGVYKLPKDSRVSDVVAAAGGLTEEANRSKINLAAKVVDGQKVNIVAKGQSTGSTEGMGSMGGEVAGVSEGGLVSVNDASQVLLETLPGIGPVTAGKIISLRPYGALEELKTKKAVGSATYEKIKDLITL